MQAQSTVAWLKAASAIVIGFGFIIAAAAYPPLSEITRFLADLVFWPIDGAQNLALPETRLLCGILGGVMTGWGIMLWLVSTRLYPHDPGLAKTLILWSVGIWFVIDSTGSIVAGAPLNAALNIVFLLLFFVPLMRSERTAHA